MAFPRRLLVSLPLPLLAVELFVARPATGEAKGGKPLILQFKMEVIDFQKLRDGFCEVDLDADPRKSPLAPLIVAPSIFSRIPSPFPIFSNALGS